MHTHDPLFGYTFSDPELERLAFTHPSCEASSGDNQRLEFLGDAVLGLVIAERLYHDLPKAREGVLASARTALVNGDSLAATARRIGLGPRLAVSESQRLLLPEPSKAMLEDCFEALVGAIYLDGGLVAARHFIERAMDSDLVAAVNSPNLLNPKTRLQEWSQASYAGDTPEYRLLKTEGPDHQRLFHAEVRLRGEKLGEGAGSSIKAAESAAALAALRHLNLDA